MSVLKPQGTKKNTVSSFAILWYSQVRRSRQSVEVWSRRIRDQIVRHLLRERRPLASGQVKVPPRLPSILWPQVWTHYFFSSPFLGKKKSIDLPVGQWPIIEEGKSMTPCRVNTILFRYFQLPLNYVLHNRSKSWMVINTLVLINPNFWHAPYPTPTPLLEK